MTCFECDRPASEHHHVIPESLGGTRTIPLCPLCHAKVHGLDGELRTRLPALQRAGIARAKARGRYNGTRESPDRAVVLLRMGFPVPEIAEALGVSAATVRRYLKEADRAIPMAGQPDRDGHHHAPRRP